MGCWLDMGIDGILMASIRIRLLGGLDMGMGSWVDMGILTKILMASVRIGLLGGHGLLGGPHGHLDGIFNHGG